MYILVICPNDVWRGHSIDVYREDNSMGASRKDCTVYAIDCAMISYGTIYFLQLKLSASHCSPVSCAPEMPPLTPEGDSDPLSDNCAVMYGTNATRRRRSKVEAWIESSSSAQSEESLSESR